MSRPNLFAFVLKPLSRSRFSQFSLFLCYDIKDPCRDIDLSPQMLQCWVPLLRPGQFNKQASFVAT